MEIEIAILVAGALAMIGGIVGGGAIYAGLEKLAKAIKNQKQIPLFKQGLVHMLVGLKLNPNPCVQVRCVEVIITLFLE